jgi:hypothetical protein
MDFSELKPAVLQEWVDNGKAKKMPAELAVYCEQLEVIRSLYSKYKSREFIIKTILAANPGLTREEAGTLYNDSLNFFYATNEVKKEAWRNIYAEKYENLSQICLDIHDLEGSRRNLDSAMKARGLDKPDEKKIPEEFYDRRPVIYVTDPKMFGLEKVSRPQLAKMIDAMDITEKEKVKLRQDAGIIDLNILEDTYEESYTEE